MTRTPAVPMVVGAGTCIAALILIPSGLAAPSAVPVLGSAHAFQAGKGFGAVKPRTVFLGGDPTGLFKSLTWTGWGKSKSTGHGKGYYPPPGKPTADAVQVPVVLVASSLGSCKGHLAYRRMAVSFEYKGHMEPGSTLGICR